MRCASSWLSYSRPCRSQRAAAVGPGAGMWQARVRELAQLRRAKSSSRCSRAPPSQRSSRRSRLCCERSSARRRGRNVGGRAVREHMPQRRAVSPSVALGVCCGGRVCNRTTCECPVGKLAFHYSKQIWTEYERSPTCLGRISWIPMSSALSRRALSGVAAVRRPHPSLNKTGNGVSANSHFINGKQIRRQSEPPPTCKISQPPTNARFVRGTALMSNRTLLCSVPFTFPLPHSPSSHPLRRPFFPSCPPRGPCRTRTKSISHTCLHAVIPAKAPSYAPAHVLVKLLVELLRIFGLAARRLSATAAATPATPAARSPATCRGCTTTTPRGTSAPCRPVAGMLHQLERASR
jgi:hypothetical protein